jgi:hypothetical protein
LGLALHTTFELTQLGRRYDATVEPLRRNSGTATTQQWKRYDATVEPTRREAPPCNQSELREGKERKGKVRLG